MADNIQFVPPPPVPVKLPLPGLVNGNILALKLGNGPTETRNLWSFMAVERATILGGDITYYGNSLLFVIGDQTLTWTRLITPYEGRLQTLAQLAHMPDPPYLRKIRMQPYPEFAIDPFLEVGGILMLKATWDPQNRYALTIRGDWCPLFRKL